MLAKCPIGRVPPSSFPQIPRHSSPPQSNPIRGVFPPFAAPPPRRGHNGKLSFSCLNMAGTRLVPTHSLAFRPECYSRVLHPTQTYRPLPRQVGGQGGSAAPRGHPPSGALQHAVPYTQKGAEPRREASRIKPTLSVRSHAAPTGISSGRIGTRTAARVRPRCGRT